MFNDWLHIAVYKHIVNAEVGVYLRKLYDNGMITNEKEFKEVLNNGYLVVKKFNRQGSVALKTKYGKGLVAISKSLTKLTKGKDIQIVTISRPEVYMEYAHIQ